MGKIVPLPDNVDRHLSLGESALRNSNFAAAVPHLEKAYQRTPVFEVGRELVQAYNGLEQSASALPIVSEYMEDFLASAKDTELLYDTLLALPDYRFAWAMLAHVAVIQRPPLQQRIEDAEAADLAANQPALEKLAKELKHLGGFDAHKQEQVIKELGRLPRQLMIEAARPNLTDEDVHPAVRISLLDALTAVGDREPVTVLGYQTSGEVVPDDLPGVLNDPTLLAVLDQVQRQVGLGDPELMRATVQVLRFELGYLYPFIDQTITDPKQFAYDYLHKDSAPLSPAMQTLLAWLGEQTAKLADMA
ncbi:hypothetical protein [Lacticaseibacillus mingshuiensis]|uniref:Tetratricopeptide repeat protein n=1 Tax=Lacticaseibacillus mingshuiensis TaxID=2799574 RepID=A0ABW4CGB5_9LACO|nr:hypothetical protein [Lacticaseibacillus mingshuiensis]